MSIKWKATATGIRWKAEASDGLAPVKNSPALKQIEKLLRTKKMITDVVVSAIGKPADKTIRVAGKYEGNPFFINLLHVAESEDGGDSNAGDMYFTVSDSIKMTTEYVVTDGSVADVVIENVKNAIVAVSKYIKSGKVAKKYVQKQNKTAHKVIDRNSLLKGLVNPLKWYVIDTSGKEFIASGPYNTESEAMQHVRPDGPKGAVYQDVMTGEDCNANGITWGTVH